MVVVMKDRIPCTVEDSLLMKLSEMKSMIEDLLRCYQVVLVVSSKVANVDLRGWRGFEPQMLLVYFWQELRRLSETMRPTVRAPSEAEGAISGSCHPDTNTPNLCCDMTLRSPLE